MTGDKGFEVIFQPEGRRCRVDKESNLLKIAEEAGVDIKSDCGGKLNCGKCILKIEEGLENLSSITDSEIEHLGDRAEEGYRLACATRAKGDLLITVPEESKRGKQVILETGLEVDIKVRPPCKKYRVKLSEPTLNDDMPDFERITFHLQKEYGIDVDTASPLALRSLPQTLRDGQGRFKDRYTATVLKNQLLRIEDDFIDEYYGIAVDIGTTTVVAYLIDLMTGKIISTASMMNPQVKYGEDVIRRVTMTIEKKDGIKKLQEVILDGLNDLIREVCNKSGKNTGEVIEITIVGNTGMHHLFAGITPEFVAKSPYVQAVSHPIDMRPKEAGLEIYEGGNVHLLPTIAGWMGADTIGCLITTEPYKHEKTQLMIDIGTNGELVLGNKEKMIGASCAAGPALEGAHIKSGMRAAPGAIQHVRIDSSTYEPELDVIGDEDPRGICGSGIIDVIAELVRTGIVQKDGQINSKIETPRLREREKGRDLEYVLAWADETSIKKDIVMNIDDIREVQLAKGAICAGVHILMDEFGIDKIDEITLAGAFGNYIDKISSLIIGLLPDVKPEKIKMIGNAAGIGARLALIDKEKRKEAEWLTEKVKYYRLAAHEDFEMEFAKSMHFPHMELDKRYPNHDKILKMRD